MSNSSLVMPLNTESGTVFLAVCNPGQVPSEFAWSMLRMLEHDRVGESAPRHLHTFSTYRWGPNVGQCRDYHVADLFDTNAHWLLQIDADMEFPPDLVDRLLAIADPVARPVVGGVYLADGGWPLAFKRSENFYHPMEIPETGLDLGVPERVFPVDGLGAGCLLVHFSVLAAIHRKWPRQYRFTPCFAEVELPNGQVLGEDLSFCWRVTELGLPVYGILGLGLGHVKTRVWREPGDITKP